jgi:hypothetical protein
MDPGLAMIPSPYDYTLFLGNFKEIGLAVTLLAVMLLMVMQVDVLDLA